MKFKQCTESSVYYSEIFLAWIWTHRQNLAITILVCSPALGINVKKKNLKSFNMQKIGIAQKVKQTCLITPCKACGI